MIICWYTEGVRYRTGTSEDSLSPESPLSPHFSPPPLRNAALKSMFPQVCMCVCVCIMHNVYLLISLHARKYTHYTTEYCTVVGMHTTLISYVLANSLCVHTVSFLNIITSFIFNSCHSSAHLSNRNTCCVCRGAKNS